MIDAAPAPLAHRVDDGPAAVHDPVEVDVDGAAPRGRVGLAELGGSHALGAAVAGVVHQDVDGADDRASASADAGRHLLVVGDVEADGDGGAAGVADRGHGVLGPLDPDVVHDDGGALGGEDPGDAGADVLSGAGHQRHLPVQLEHGCCPPSGWRPRCVIPPKPTRGGPGLGQVSGLASPSAKARMEVILPASSKVMTSVLVMAIFELAEVDVDAELEGCLAAAHAHRADAGHHRGDAEVARCRRRSPGGRPCRPSCSDPMGSSIQQSSAYSSRMPSVSPVETRARRSGRRPATRCLLDQPWSVSSVAVDDDAADVLAVPHVLVALVDVVQACRCG